MGNQRDTGERLRNGEASNEPEKWKETDRYREM